MAFVAGAAAGAVVALLTAPRSGRDTRARLRSLAEDAAEKAGRARPALDRAARAAREAFEQTFDEHLKDTDAPPAGEH